MFKSLFNSMRKKSLALSDLPGTVRVPSHGGMSPIDGLPLADASVDDLAFAIQGLESELAHLCRQLTALRRLHHLAGVRGACGTDKVRAILGGGR